MPVTRNNDANPAPLYAAVWVAAAETGNARLVPFPVLAFLLMVLLACVSAVAAWQSPHRSKKA